MVNVGSAHIGEFGSVETIAKAKSELVQALPAAADGGVAILNADDPLVAAMAALTTAAVVTVGRTPGAVIRAEDVTQDDADQAGFTLVTPEGSATVALQGGRRPSGRQRADRRGGRPGGRYDRRGHRRRAQLRDRRRRSGGCRSPSWPAASR